MSDFDHRIDKLIGMKHAIDAERAKEEEAKRQKAEAAEEQRIAGKNAWENALIALRESVKDLSTHLGKAGINLSLHHVGAAPPALDMVEIRLSLDSPNSIAKISLHTNLFGSIQLRKDMPVGKGGGRVSGPGHSISAADLNRTAADKMLLDFAEEVMREIK